MSSPPPKPKPKPKPKKPPPAGVVGPLFGWELLRLARRGQDARGRFILAVALFLVLTAFSLIWFRGTSPYDLFFGGSRSLTVQETATFGHSFSLTFVLGQLGILCLLTPAYAAGGIAEEKDKKTMVFLLVSGLTDREIVFGKFFGRTVFLLGILFAGLPILAITQLHGGVSPAFLGFSYLLTATTVILLSAASAAAAAQAETYRGGLFRAYGLTALVVLAGCGVGPYVSPFAVVFYLDMLEGPNPAWFLGLGFGFPALQLAVAALAVLLAMRAVRRLRTQMVRKSPKPPPWVRERYRDEDREKEWKAKQERKREEAVALEVAERRKRAEAAVVLELEADALPRRPRTGRPPGRHPPAVEGAAGGAGGPTARPTSPPARPAAPAEGGGAAGRPPPLGHRPPQGQEGLPRPGHARRQGLDAQAEGGRVRPVLLEGEAHHRHREDGRRRGDEGDDVPDRRGARPHRAGVPRPVVPGRDERQRRGPRVRPLAPAGGGRGGGVFAHLLQIGMAAAGTISRERQRLTLESLLTIPAPRRAILWPKWLVSLLRGWWWGAPAAAVIAIAFLTTDSAVAAVPAAAYLLAAVPFATSYGVWLSVRCTSVNRAVMWFLPVGGGLTLFPIGVCGWASDGTLWWLWAGLLFGVTWLLIAGAFVFWKLTVAAFDHESILGPGRK